METGSLYNFKTIADIFMKLGSNIKHCHLTFRDFTLILDEEMGEISVFV